MKRLSTKEVKELTKRQKKKLPVIMRGYGLLTRLALLDKTIPKLNKSWKFDLKENWIYFDESDKEIIENAIKEVKAEVKKQKECIKLK